MIGKVWTLTEALVPLTELVPVKAEVSAATNMQITVRWPAWKNLENNAPVVFA